jgi:glutamate racemase
MCTYIDARRVGGLDSVILGCTHYSFLADQLKERYGEAVHIFAQTEIIPQKLALYLERHEAIRERLQGGGKRNVYLTEHRADYDQLMSTILQGSFLVDEQ